MTNKLTTTGRWWILWLTVGILMCIGIFSIGKCSAQNDSLAYFPYPPIDHITTTTGTINLENDKDIALEQLKAYIKECLEDSIIVAYKIRYRIKGSESDFKVFNDTYDTIYINSTNRGITKDFRYFTIDEIVIPKEVTIEGFEEYLSRNRDKEILNKLK